MAQKQTYRSMEENREPRNKATYLWSINPTKETRLSNRKETISSTSSVGKAEQLHVNQ